MHWAKFPELWYWWFYQEVYFEFSLQIAFICHPHISLITLHLLLGLLEDFSLSHRRLWMEDTSGAHLVSSSAQARSTTAGCPGVCPGFWVLPNMEPPQPLWVTCDSKKSRSVSASVLFLPWIMFSCLRENNLCWRNFLSCRDSWQLGWGKQWLPVELLRWAIGVMV